MMTPPVDTLRDVLRRVTEGVFATDPDAAVQDLSVKQVAALTWAVEEGLVDDGRIALTELGARFYAIITGGAA